MSEKPQHASGAPPKPNETVELSPQAEASERSLPRRVSRETSDLTPEQAMLNDILDRAMAKYQDTPKEDAEQAPPQEDAPSPAKEETPPSLPEKNKPASAYIYLAVLFGAAFLMLLLAYFVQQRNNDAVLDDLRSTTASREELLADITALKEERDRLQQEVEYQKSLAEQKAEETQQFQQFLEETSAAFTERSLEKKYLEYFWYLDQFMDSEDYLMAAALTALSADWWRDTWQSQLSLNPAQIQQYEAYRQELINKGYLVEGITTTTEGNRLELWFTPEWDPSRNADTAAMDILWLALDAHFVIGTDEAASQYLCRYAMGNPVTGYQERVEQLASSFTLNQFQLLKDQLVESQWLVVAEDGTMTQGPGSGFSGDTLYGLPFTPPVDTPENQS